METILFVFGRVKMEILVWLAKCDYHFVGLYLSRVEWSSWLLNSAKIHRKRFLYVGLYLSRVERSLGLMNSARIHRKEFKLKPSFEGCSNLACC
jgi:hypothetical protein